MVTNKALNIHRERRYQDARAFRAALEQVSIHCDWLQHPKTGGTCWSGTCGRMEVMVEMAVSSRGDAAVETRKRTAPGSWRRVIAACKSGMRTPAAQRFVRNILTRYATTGSLA